MISHRAFVEAVERVDEQLKRQEVPIHARPIRAIPMVAQELGIPDGVPLLPAEDSPRIDSSNLAHKVQRWYEKYYGERIRTWMGPGSFGIRIRGDVWRVRLPLIYGSVNLTLDRSYEETPKFFSDGTIPDANVLTHIVGFPKALGAELTDGECLQILEEYAYSLNVLQAICDLSRDSRLLVAASSDLESSVASLVESRGDKGQSRWSSLQFAEKVMKWRITFEGERFPNTHRLQELARILESVASVSIPTNLIDLVQCSAGVRYGAELVTQMSAWEAHRSSIRIAGAALPPSAFSF